MKATIAVPDWATQVISDLTDMDRAPHPVDASRVSRFTLELPDDAYFEYAFVDADGRVRADPDNPRRGDNPWYPEVSVLTGPDYRPHPLAEPDAGANHPPRGELSRHRLRSAALGQLRRASVYTPAGFASDAPLPLLLVQDGTAYLRLAKLDRVLEALLAGGAARPARLAFVEPVDRRAEYGFDPAYRRFLLDELLPELQASHPSDGELLLMGASLGGLASVALALEHPERVSALATQSGAFLGTPDAREFFRTERSWVLDELVARPQLPWRAYTECGTLEWLTEVNRRVHEELAARAADHAYEERNAGHNWTNWRNGLADALAFLLHP